MWSSNPRKNSRISVTDSMEASDNESGDISLLDANRNFDVIEEGKADEYDALMRI